jgi:hypothetical protein
LISCCAHAREDFWIRKTISSSSLYLLLFIWFLYHSSDCDETFVSCCANTCKGFWVSTTVFFFFIVFILYSFIRMIPISFVRLQ